MVPYCILGKRTCYANTVLGAESFGSGFLWRGIIDGYVLLSIYASYAPIRGARHPYRKCPCNHWKICALIIALIRSSGTA